jgi:hypothetical protein
MRQYRAPQDPRPRPAPAGEALRVIIDAPTITAFLDEVTRRQPVFHGAVTLPTFTHRVGIGCRTPIFGACDPCRDYPILSPCSSLRQRSQPCGGQPTQTDGRKLVWASQPCPASQPDCAVMASGIGFELSTERASVEVPLRRASLQLGDGRLAAAVALGGVKLRASTTMKLLDRCGRPTRLPLMPIPEHCADVEAGIDASEPIRLEAALRLESRGQELRGRLERGVALKLPPGSPYVKQQCYRGTFFGYNLGDIVERETAGALQREWSRREDDARNALDSWLSERLSRPLVDAIPPSFRVPAAGGEVVFFPRLSSVHVTPAAITVQAEAQVLLPYDLLTRQLAALGKVRASRSGDDPLWLSDFSVEQGPGGTLLVRASYTYEWTRARLISGGGRGKLAFSGHGELRDGVLQLHDVELRELDPTDRGCFDERLVQRIEAALRGDEIRRLEIKLQAQYDAAVEQLRSRRLTREGFAIDIHPDSLTAVPTFEREGVRLHLSGNLRPRLAPSTPTLPAARPRQEATAP